MTCYKPAFRTFSQAVNAKQLDKIILSVPYGVNATLQQLLSPNQISERIVKKGIVPIRAGSGWTTGASNTNQL